MAGKVGHGLKLSMDTSYKFPTRTLRSILIDKIQLGAMVDERKPVVLTSKVRHRIGNNFDANVSIC